VVTIPKINLPTFFSFMTVAGFQPMILGLSVKCSTTELPILIVSNLYVKQQSVSDQYIAINDSMEMLARDFISEGEGKRARQPRGRERVCVGGRALGREGDGVGNKIVC
jgi:hypothetical protein